MPKKITKNRRSKAPKTVSSSFYYNSISNSYEELHEQEQMRKLLIAKEFLNLKKEDSLLDVGSGIGISADIFDCKITMLDNSKELLRIAKSKLSNNDTVNLVFGNAEKMPFGNKEFDAAICITAIHNFSSPSKALKEILRVTKNGNNNIIVSVLKKSSKREKIIKLLEGYFEIKGIVDEKKDMIFCLEHKE
jgi:ubiquinone/menaquinone biosynthesis C-methylase UbiE